MATFQLTLRKRNITSDLFPIIIRVIQNRRSKETVILNIKVPEKSWDRKQQLIKSSFPKSTYFNKKLVQIKRNIENRIIELDDLDSPYKASDVLQALSNTNNNGNSDSSLYSFIMAFMDKNPDNIKPQTLKYYKSTANKWKEVFPNLDIRRITEDNVIEFRKYLKEIGNNDNTIYNRLKVLRRIFNYAVMKKTIKVNPMANIKLVKKKADRVYLTMSEISRIESYKPQNKTEEISKDIFLFECYTGLRISDICTLKRKEVIHNTKETRIKKKLGKTQEMLTMKLSKKANIIYSKYVSSEAYIFPFLNTSNELDEIKLYNKISSTTTIINRSLKVIAKNCKIEKSVSTHIGRHSFAVNSITMGGDIYVLSKLLGHTSIKTTEIYAKAVDKKKDELIDLWDDFKRT